MEEEARIGGVVIAGGESRRLGRDKMSCLLEGKSLFARTIDRLGRQVATCAVSLAKHGDSDFFADTTLITDILGPDIGPLAGLHASMEWAKNSGEGLDWIVTTPVDTPFLPMDFVKKLARAASRNAVLGAISQSGNQIHPLHGIWSIDLAGPLKAALERNDVKSVHSWVASLSIPAVCWDSEPLDPFFNINTESDLEIAAAAIRDGLAS